MGPLVSGPGHMDNMEIFVRKLSEKLGPASGTGKLLTIDGVPFHLNEGLAQLFDYGIGSIIRIDDCLWCSGVLGTGSVNEIY